MNISFGEHYYASEETSLLLQVSLAFIGAFIGFGFSLYLYYKKQRDDIQKSKIEQNNYQKQRLFYFKEILESTQKNFSDQLCYLNDYISRQEKDLGIPQELKLIATDNFERLRASESDELFKAWTSLLPGRSEIAYYKSISSSIDFLSAKKHELHRIFNTTNKVCDKKLVEVEELIDHIFDILFITSIEINTELKEDRYFIHINHYLNIYNKLVSKKASLKEYNSEFLNPLVNEFSKEFLNRRNSYQILSTAKKARTKLSYIKAETEAALKKLKPFEGECKDSLGTIKNAVVKIEHLHIPK